jgi:hypothetical protein
MAMESIRLCKGASKVPSMSHDDICFHTVDLVTIHDDLSFPFDYTTYVADSVMLNNVRISQSIKVVTTLFIKAYGEWRHFSSYC